MTTREPTEDRRKREWAKRADPGCKLCGGAGVSKAKLGVARITQERRCPCTRRTG